MSQLHTTSEELKAEKEFKDRVSAHLPQITSIPIDTPSLKDANTMLIPTHLPTKVGSLEGRKVDSICGPPILFSNTLQSIPDGDFYRGGPMFAEESIVEKTATVENGLNPLKYEWVEKCEPGVYITFINLPSEQKGVKRVRFR